jgi:hypothetical protein
MSDRTIIDEILGAVDLLRKRGVPAAASLLDQLQGRVIFDEALRAFVHGGDRRWWWESFKLPHISRHFSTGDGWRRLAEIAPDPNELVWFIAEEDRLPFYPVFEMTPSDASHVIGECCGFEYYLVSKNYEWLICENHHDTVFAVGSDVSARLSNLSNQERGQVHLPGPVLWKRGSGSLSPPAICEPDPIPIFLTGPWVLGVFHGEQER